jgi:hypothetical protein
VTSGRSGNDAGRRHGGLETPRKTPAVQFRVPSQGRTDGFGKARPAAPAGYDEARHNRCSRRHAAVECSQRLRPPGSPFEARRPSGAAFPWHRAPSRTDFVSRHTVYAGRDGPPGRPCGAGPPRRCGPREPRSRLSSGWAHARRRSPPTSVTGERHGGGLPVRSTERRGSRSTLASVRGPRRCERCDGRRHREYGGGPASAPAHERPTETVPVPVGRRRSGGVLGVWPERERASTGRGVGDAHVSSRRRPVRSGSESRLSPGPDGCGSAARSYPRQSPSGLSPVSCRAHSRGT